MSAAILALAVVALAAAAFAQLLAPVEGRRTERELLRGEQRQLASRAEESRVFVLQQQRLLEEIGDLQHMMRDVDPELYRERIERLEAAQRLLEKQIRIERELAEEYEKARRILEVEMETERLVGRLEQEVVERITERLAELDATREANRELRFQLEANEEVERLLRGRARE
jgi:hypothetical protein